MCDFCSSEDPRWEYPAKTFTIPGPGGQPYTSAGAWAACESCAALIERGDRNTLLNHYLADKPAELRPIMRPWGLKLHQGFFANRTGPRKPAIKRFGLSDLEPEPETERERILRESPALAVADALTGIFGGGPRQPDSSEELMCDFDLARPVVWSYPANSYTLIPVPNSKIAWNDTWTSEGDWAACAACARLVEAHDVEGLVERNLRAHNHELQDQLATLRERNIHEQVIRQFAADTRQGTRAITEGFFTHRTGDRRPVAGIEQELPTPSHEAQIAFGEQLTLLRLIESPRGQELVDEMVEATGLPLPRSFWTVPLRYGETYYWSPEICQLIHGSAEQLDPTPWTLTREALPATSGFFYCHRPIADTPLGPLRGLAWTLAFAEIGERRWDLIINPQGRGSPDTAIGIMLSWYVERSERISPAGLSIWRFGEDHITEPGMPVEVGNSEHYDRATLDEMMRRHKAALSTMLAFIQQRILYPSRPHRPDRTTRKIAERERPEQAPTLRVVELRRRQRPDYVPPTEHKDVDWQVQWVVRGFWRNQFYPSLDRHQPRWIAPYVKGPLDKPFKTPKPEIFLVDR